MANVEFSFICRRRFDELAGDDKLNRFCGSCGREVINLDLLTEDEQQEISVLTASAGVKVCISATVRRNAMAVPRNVLASPCVTRDKPTPGVMVGEMRAPYDSPEPFSEAEADSRITEIFIQVRKRLQQPLEEEPQELRKLLRRESEVLGWLMVTLQPQCSPEEPKMILQKAKDEGLDYRFIHEVASRNGIYEIQSLEEMRLE